MSDIMVKKKHLNTKPILLIIGIIVIVAAFVTLRGEEANYYEFASCMQEKGIIEIGSDTCLHCENQKRIIGHDAFKKNFDEPGNYLRCNVDPILCGELNIKGTPTWYVPSDAGAVIIATGSKFKVSGTYDEHLGELSILKLAEISGCAVPEDYDSSIAVDTGGFTGG
jgi:hypothetical protein